MVQSMTGFGRAQKKGSAGEIIVELQSLNRKNFEANIHLPWGLSSFETQIRKLLAESLLRGSVQCKVFFTMSELPDDAIPDIKKLKKLQSKWREIAQKLNVDPDQIDLLFLTQQMKNLSRPEGKVDLQKVQKSLMECVKKSLTELLQMRKKEGAFLQKELNKLLEELKQNFQKIQKLYPKSLQIYREKLQKKMQELTAEDSIKKEVLTYAEKIDITEELVRFMSHIKQYHQILKSSAFLKGRKMEFLLQEMSREMNTVCSKSVDGQIVSLAVECKSILEKIREQVLNIQ